MILRPPITALLSFLTGLVLAAGVSGQSPLQISEFLADNKRGLEDEDGDASDWIELYNRGDSAVDLAGYALTDDTGVLQKWVFPSLLVAAGESVVVFASGKDRTVGGGELHANFSLAAAGGYLALVAADGVTVVSEYADYPEQFADVAYGQGTGRRYREVVVADGDEWRWLVPTAETAGWNAPGFDDGAWGAGRSGFGYEAVDNGLYLAFLGEGGDVEQEMYGERPSLYLRREWPMGVAGTLLSMTLRARYDDGFVVYLNGSRVAGVNDPEPLAYDSSAVAEHPDDLAVRWEEIDLSEHLGLLQRGASNLVAVQAMNDSATSADFLVSVELEVSLLDETRGMRVGYLPVPSPGGANGESFDGLVEDTKFSLGRGFYTTPQLVEISTATEGAEIRYTTDGTVPTATTGELYAGPVSIDGTTILRAAAFRERWAPTNTDTQTYVFVDDVVEQVVMEPAVVDGEAYKDTIRSDLSTNLPVVSLVVDHEQFFGPLGIHREYEDRGREAEVPISVEFFDPLAGGEFQIDGGVRLHGGNARSHPKKPFRLYFRGEYGDAKLRFPLFPGSDVEVFDQLLLRAGGHDSWSLAPTFGIFDEAIPPHATLMRDQFMRKSEREIGILSPAGRYVHVYINAYYWGVYDLHERPNADFFAAHLGGDAEDWDVVHHPDDEREAYHVVVDGVDTDWDRLMGLVRPGGVNSQELYDEMAGLLEIDDFIDHLIVRMWSGDYDWCRPLYRGNEELGLFNNHNWYAGRQGRNGNRGGFRLFTWDGEMSMGLHLMANFLRPFPAQRVVDFDLTRASGYRSPAFLYWALKKWPAFQRRFGDRLYRHFFNGGVMTVENNRARLAAMEDEIEEAMVCESARWGNMTGFLFTRDEHWRSEVSWLKETFMGQRNDIVLEQFRSQGLYPDVAPPAFSSSGGEVAAGFQLTMTAGDGVMYYTTDGSDPQDLPDTVSPTAVAYGEPLVLAETQLVRARVRSAAGQWSALAEAMFLVGPLAGAENLRISEIHYRPLGPGTPGELAAGGSRGDFEFLELVNISGEAIDLTGVEFDAGVSWEFDDGARKRILGGGERLLLVANETAFLARYGDGLAGLVAGEFREGTRLANGGEWLRLLAADGKVIHEVRYGDTAPWPVEADGDGPSLVLTDPVGAVELGNAWAWATSAEVGGSPGIAGEVVERVETYAGWRGRVFDPLAADFEVVSAPDFDADGDGVSNVFEYISGGDALVAGGSLEAEFFVAADGHGFRYRRAVGLLAPVVVVEMSADLIHWEAVGVRGVESVTDRGDGTETVVVTLAGADLKLQGFRLRATVTP